MTGSSPYPARSGSSGSAELTAHTRWMRALARSLVADANLADDLVQDTWLAVLRRPATAGPSPRAWLATVLRRRLAERRRESAARTQREVTAARREALPSTLAMVERAAVQRDLVQAVLDLEEPYRTTILWRFFEELPPREIARRAGVPVATVHTRIARGLARLRESLDREHGGDGLSWALALLPVLKSPGPAWMGALLLKTSTQIALASACAAAVLAAIILRSSNGTAPSSDPSRSEALASERPPRSDPEPKRGSAIDLAGAEPDAGRADAAEVRPTRPSESAAAPARKLRGEVLDPKGDRLAGVALRFSPGDATPMQSGADGRFDVALPASAETVLSADPRWATVLAGSARVAPTTVAIVVVAARLDLAGTVVDEEGKPLLGAELSVHVPRSFGADFGRPLDASVERAWRARSDAAGAFELADVPAIPDAALHVALGGFDEHVQPLPTFADRGMRIVLARPRAAANRLGGIVVDPAGALVPGARVSVGWESTFTDASGRFELDVAKDPAPDRVTAAKSGFLPAVREATRSEAKAGEAGKPTWPAEILLRLGGAPRTIQGRVLAGTGDPVAGARVWLVDPTYFGLVESEPVQVETLLGRKDAPFWSYATTRGDGSFEIAGLLERRYKIQALDPVTLLAATSEPVEAGASGVEIRLPKDALRERVAGRVVARDGSPIAGASVVVQRFAFSVNFPGGGTRDEFAPRPEVKTDDDGRFEIRDVPKSGVELFVHGESILFWSMDLEEKTVTDDLKIVVNRRMHLQIELDAPIDRADELRVLDGDGNPMILRIMRGETSFTNRKAEIVEGRSQVLSTAEDARTVVFFKAGVEVGRVPIALRTGEVSTIRF